MAESIRKLCRILTTAGYWLKVRLLGLRMEAVMNRLTAGILACMAAVLLIVPAVAQKSTGADAMFEAARQKETLEGDLSAAIKEYSAIVAKYKSDRAVTAMAL